MSKGKRSYSYDLTGKRVGKLTVLRYVGNSHWECRCDCGKYTCPPTFNLTHNKTSQCHSCAVKKHGLNHTPEQKVWADIKQRCYNPNEPNYKNYGARGIKMHEPWINSREQFYKDIGPRPGNSYQLDRINNDGDYEPQNVRWVDVKTNARNKRSNRYFVINGKKKCLADWCDIYKIPYDLVWNRLQRGWDIKKSLTLPINKAISDGRKRAKLLRQKGQR